MFLKEFQHEEKYAFLELAALITRVDGHLSIDENWKFQGLDQQN